jgi:hypothetical protein
MKKLDILSLVKSNDRGAHGDSDGGGGRNGTPVVCLCLLVDAIIAPACRSLNFTFNLLMVIHPLPGSPYTAW